MATAQAFQNLIVSVSAGERIFTEGEIGTTMFIVQSGRVRIFRGTGEKEVTISEMEKGDFFGEMSLLEGTPRNMSAQAIDDAELIEINSTTFDRMIRSNVEIAVRLLRKLSGRLMKAENLIVTQRGLLDGASRDGAKGAASVPGLSIPGRIAPVESPAAASAMPGQPEAPAPPGLATARGSAASGAAPGAPLRAATPPAAPVVPGAAKPGSISSTHPPTPSARPGARAAAGAIRLAVGPRTAPQKGPRLVSESGDTVFPLAGNDALVGRYDPVTETQPEVDLTLLDIKRSVSRRHARITLVDGAHFLTEEVGALNGTFINGSKLVTGRPSPLKNEDRVSVGTVQLVFRT